MSYNLHKPFLSVIIPTYKGAHNFQALVAALDASLAKVSLLKHAGWELIFVDDASPTLGHEALRRCKPCRFPCRSRRYYYLKQHVGQHTATLFGLVHASGRYLLTMDDDLQHPPTAIPLLLDEAFDSLADIVYGTYDAQRSLGSRLFSRLLCWLGILADEYSSFRLLDPTLLDALLEKRCTYLFLESLIAACRPKVRRIAVLRAARVAGRSQYSLMKRIDMALRIIHAYGWSAKVIDNLQKQLGKKSSFKTARAFLHIPYLAWNYKAISTPTYTT